MSSIADTAPSRGLSIFERLARHIRRERVRRRTIAELSRLTHRELEDIGIHHSMITRLANEAAEEVR